MSRHLRRLLAATAAAALLGPGLGLGAPAYAQQDVDTSAPPPPSGDSAPSGMDDGDPLDAHPAEPRIGTASAADPERGSLCLGYSGIDRANPVEQVMQGQIVLTDRPAVQVTRRGQVDWSLDPYGDPTWRLWFQSLRWTGSLLRAGNEAALQHGVEIARQWVANHTVAQLQGQDAEAVRHRANVLLCLRELTGPLDWLDRSLDDHARFLIDNYSGDWNHGLDDNLALYGVGCILERSDLRGYALQRNDNLVDVALHPDGGTNEQALGYDLYVFRRLRLLLDMARRCGDTVAAQTQRLVDAMPTFLAHATKPNGVLPNLGDSYAHDRPDSVPGPMAYVRSGGAVDAPPAERARIFASGYAFGRSGWGEGGRAFADESWWGARFGPARDVHGHEDRTSLLWHARGIDLLVDSGHVGYERTAYREFLSTPQAHNVLTVEGERWRSTATRLTRSDLRAGADFLEFEDRSYPGAPRQRSILVATDPDVVVVYDRADTATTRTFTQRWHLPPGTEATPVGRSFVDARLPDGHTKLIVQQVPFAGQELAAGATRVVAGRSSPLQGWRSFQVRERTAAPTVEMRRTGTSTRHLSVLTATDPGNEVLHDLVRTTDGSYLLSVQVGDQPFYARISPGGWLSRADGPVEPANRDTFIDDDSNVHQANIELLVAAEITFGCDTTGARFCPDGAVTRGQLATFLSRALDLPAATTDHFDDDDGTAHEDAINRAADAGIVQGVGERTYRSDAPVSRAASASMLVRALDLDAATRDHFGDDDGSTHEAATNALAERGITQGCSADGTRFCPTLTLTRGQMASLLVRALGLE